MSALIPFDFESNAVRVVEIDGEPWFVAADVCRVLEHTNPTKAVKVLDAHQRREFDLNTLTSSSGIQADGVGIADTIGGARRGNPNVTIISEGGLYKLVTRSKLAVTPGTVQHRFANWVFDVLLPSLRKYGSFTLGDDRLVKGRAAYAAAPQKTKDDAEDRVAAVMMYERLVAGGMRKGAAKDEVCLVLGVTSAPLARWIATTRMVAGPDMAAALANKGIGPRGMQAPCHPEALAYCADQFRAGVRPSVAYQRTQEEAVRQGWSPIPCEKTMTRNCRTAAGLSAPKLIGRE
ncbi:BRO-N domain-containing protein [Rhodobacter capsulatus]|uniref:BRO-N domain-containing protein n=1 Tax=Rhodobacter capsulatus TaxID=1061 RepID=UPI0040279329